jgi:hypothetical protein
MESRRPKISDYVVKRHGWHFWARGVNQECKPMKGGHPYRSPRLPQSSRFLNAPPGSRPRNGSGTSPWPTGAAGTRGRRSTSGASASPRPAAIGRASTMGTIFRRTAARPVFRLRTNVKEAAFSNRTWSPFGRGCTCACLHATTALYGFLGELLSDLTRQQTITV